MNRTLLALSLLCIAFAACKKNDSTPLPLTDDNATKKALIGTWHYTSYTASYYTNGVLTTSNTGFTTSDEELFYNDGTVSDISSGATQNFNYSVHNNVLTFTFGSGISDIDTIKLLTPKTLYFHYDQSLVSGGTTYRTIVDSHLGR